jgi:hypothetical protein
VVQEGPAGVDDGDVAHRGPTAVVDGEMTHGVPATTNDGVVHNAEYEDFILNARCLICREVLSLVEQTRSGDNCEHEFCEGNCYNLLVGTTNRCPHCQARLDNDQL